ncbi:hypothetical protein CBR_g4812 [Chara braunii]|uniref:Peptidase M20 dimerisation domain-containing protein n=1 Tax=Chara braunii TaxID=69332 RepID=A0A388KIV4_CHABU|nr:hypothetical protein CBR_g4812 [Chara braunii]|eukprot:GBG69984.1 hypothetical protein CBR_g4812 [Chara braunii]
MAASRQSVALNSCAISWKGDDDHPDQTVCVTAWLQKMMTIMLVRASAFGTCRMKVDCGNWMQRASRYVVHDDFDGGAKCSRLSGVTADHRWRPAALHSQTLCLMTLIAVVMGQFRLALSGQASVTFIAAGIPGSRVEMNETQCKHSSSYSSSSSYSYSYAYSSSGAKICEWPSLTIDVDVLQKQLDHLGTISDTAPPAVTRVLFSSNDLLARRYVRSLMEAHNLTVREDAIGNLFGRWEGKERTLPPVATGSHTDAVPFAGKYDGVLGVLGAIEAVAALKRAGFVPTRSIEVIMFTSEEPTRFGIGCVGSWAMSGHPGIGSRLMTAKDNEGLSFKEAAARAGYTKVKLPYLDDVVLPPNTYSAFLELHIEQGPLLEQEGVPIGVVTAIAAATRLKVDFRGDGGHAGSVLMPDRHDAGLAAAELALAVEAAVLATGSLDTVGTTGIVKLSPNAINSISREAHIQIDVRDTDPARRGGVVDAIRHSVIEIAERRRVEYDMQIITEDPPTACSPTVVHSVAQAAQFLKLKHKYMVSRACHDALFMAQSVPTGMIFIPCLGGISHRPEEFASKESMAAGIHVLALSLADLSSPSPCQGTDDSR